MEVLKKEVVTQRRVKKVYYKLSETYRDDNDKITELYE